MQVSRNAGMTQSDSFRVAGVHQLVDDALESLVQLVLIEVKRSFPPIVRLVLFDEEAVFEFNVAVDGGDVLFGLAADFSQVFCGVIKSLAKMQNAIGDLFVHEVWAPVVVVVKLKICVSRAAFV